MIHVGIDPGAKGGIAVIGESEVLVDCFPYSPDKLVEILKQPYGSGASRIMDKAHVTIEKTWAFPGMGVTGAHKYGIGAGFTHGILFALGIPYSLVAPVRWQKAIIHGAEGATPKARAWARAQQLWPNQHNWFLKPRGGVHDGLVDAALIAEYGRRTHGK